VGNTPTARERTSPQKRFRRPGLPTVHALAARRAFDFMRTRLVLLDFTLALLGVCRDLLQTVRIVTGRYLR